MELGTTTLFANAFGLFWRRQWVVYLCLLLTCSAAYLYYVRVGDRYEAYTLLRVGQGIKERSGNANIAFGEGVDLQSRMESLARMAKIDFVIHEAATRTGYDRLSPGAEKPVTFKFLEALPSPVRAWVEAMSVPGAEIEPGDAPAKDTTDVQEAIDHNQPAIHKLRDRVTAKQEGRADLLRVLFRHPDPTIAARYLDELANALVAIHNTDVQVPGAQEFFYQQMKRLEQEAELAATNLQNFSVKASIYAVDEQRQLLLRRANELATILATTRGLIQDRKGQKQAIVDQLEILKPVTHSRTVTRVVRTLGGQNPRPAVERATTEQLEETPPLLLVKVYQDNMASLMKVNADLSGATELLSQLSIELENVNRQLALLAAQEAEYEKLKRVFTTASTSAAHYANRMAEEQINSEVAKKSQLSSLRVVQRATPPTSPVFPQVPHLIGFALFGGILLGVAIILGAEFARESMHRTRTAAASPVSGDDDTVNLLNLLVARQRKEGLRDHQSA